MNIENIKQYIPDSTGLERFNNVVIFEVKASDIKQVAYNLHTNKNFSLKLITAVDEREEQGCFKIWYIFGLPKENVFIIPFIKLIDTIEFPSLTSLIYKASNYERKIYTFFGLLPTGHPDLRPLILHENWPAGVFPLRKDFNGQMILQEANDVYKFQRVEGEGIYEIPVGPIHAGIIEPGHFRFSVAGERIVLLEPRLGFTHKGSEKLFEILPLNDKIRLSEKISGDSSFSHSLSFCQALEYLSDIHPPKRGQYLRVIYAELERLANHFGDIGAIMLDSGYNFGGAHGARLREMIMQINERITGSRFLRGVNVVGGVTKDIDSDERNTLSLDLKKISEDFSEILKVIEISTSLLNRLKGTGVLSLETAKEHGMTGVAAKASGLQIDTRSDFPYAAYDELHFNIAEAGKEGDVYSRFYVRINEAFASIKLIQSALNGMPEGSISTPAFNNSFKKNSIAINVVEGWRGEILYFVTTDAQGNISRVVSRDPSFVNWPALSDAAFENVIPDFPLINKSFNLSYSGNDL